MYHHHHHQGSPSSSSSPSQSQGSMGPSGLTRYGSAPGSLLASAVDSVVAQSQPHLIRHHPLFFSSSPDNTTPPPPPPLDPKQHQPSKQSTTTTTTTASSSSTVNLLQRSYAFNDAAAASPAATAGGGGGGGCGSHPLIRHSSSPAGFLSHLTSTASAPDNGFSVTRGIGNYNSKGVSSNGPGISRLNSQLSFTRQDCLSHISEEDSDNVGDDDVGTENSHRKVAHSYATASSSFRMGSWDDTNSIMFSVPPGKRTKNVIDSSVHGLSSGESQIHFSLPQTTLEMATMENMLHIPQDSVPCKIRAKRGCATHPRSIAERERRTRISGKLRKLQELVPNMDKQTSYADMLDLAVQHIKGLQSQVKKLNKELESCTCGCKQAK